MIIIKKKFFKIAREESKLSDFCGAHIGAIAVYKDKFIIARAHNMEKTNTTQWYYNRFRLEDKNDLMTKPSKSHAEINLYRKIRYLDIDFKKVTVYVYRELKNGALALAAPCKACEQALRALGIRNICYTTNEGYIQKKFYEENNI